MQKKTTVERSAGAVVFRREGALIFYLLLHYELGHWDLPKGHIEKGEKTEGAARREVLEETGITDLEFISGFKKTIEYRYAWPPKAKEQEFRMKFVAFFLGETRQSSIVISDEHIGFVWLPYDGALDKLTYKTAKDVLMAGDSFLKKYGKKNI